MNNPVFIFMTGLTGVFIGMGLLYVSIRLTALIVERIEQALKPKSEDAS